jgi:hypothetical protein
VERRASRFRSFKIPSKSERENLELGNLVKLVFETKLAQPFGVSGERMWVKVLGESEEGCWAGSLINSPVGGIEIRPGDVLLFESKHVCAIIRRSEMEFE